MRERLRFWLWEMRLWLAMVIAPSGVTQCEAEDVEHLRRTLVALYLYQRKSGHLCNRTKAHRRLRRDIEHATITAQNATTPRCALPMPRAYPAA